MFFRFGVAVLVVVAVSLYGTALESEILAMKRQIIRQRYRIDVATQSLAQLRLDVQMASSPVHLLPRLEQGELMAVKPPFDDQSVKPPRHGTSSIAEKPVIERPPIRRQ